MSLMAERAMAVADQSRNPGLPLGFSCGCSRVSHVGAVLKHLRSTPLLWQVHEQTRSEMEQSGHDQVPIWDAGITGSDLIFYTTLQAPRAQFLN